MYFTAIRQQHPDWEMEQIRAEYGDMLDYLLTPSEDVKPFFARVPVYRTQTEIETLAANLHATALEMTSPKTALYPAPGFMNCRFCHFLSPCLAMNSGSDHEFLLANEYRQRSADVRIGEEEEEVK
jgi:hypothetical protein